jgi:hypothetical protein
VTLSKLRRVRTPKASKRRPKISLWRESRLIFRRLKSVLLSLRSSNHL